MAGLGNAERSMRVAIVENTDVTHHGQVGVALHEAGARIDVFHPFRGQPLPIAQDGYDALVVLGGEQAATDDHLHPYLPQVATLMRDMTTQGRAVLGICLGSQILARAYGAENQLGTAPEFGWCDVTLTEEGRTDPVMRHLATTFPIFEFHTDTFTLPQGAVHLAQTKTAPHQAFRIGRATYGMQFHFEANRAVVADWTREFPDIVEARQPGWAAGHPALAKTRGLASDAAGLAIARAWVALI
jgi:GMP synthase (glutamine-hydrolysing)